MSCRSGDTVSWFKGERYSLAQFDTILQRIQFMPRKYTAITWVVLKFWQAFACWRTCYLLSYVRFLQGA